MATSEKNVFRISAWTREGLPIPFWAETEDEAYELAEKIRNEGGRGFEPEEFLEVKVDFFFPEKQAKFIITTFSFSTWKEEEYTARSWEEVKRLEKKLMDSGKYDDVYLADVEIVEC